MKIPIRSWLVALTSFISLNTTAQQPTTANSSLLWKIEKPGNHHVSYLFGTIHIIPKNQYFEPKGLQMALEQTEALVLEMAIDIPLKEQLELMSTMVYPSGKTLQDYVDSSDFEAFKEYCLTDLKIKNKKFERYIRLKPIALSSVLMKEALGKTTAFELELSKMAKKKKHPIIGLETLKQQMSFLDSIETNSEQELVKDTLMLSSYFKMVELYKKQDLEGLFAMMADENGSTETFQQILLVNRNKSWMMQLESMLENKAVFIAVGAAHLPSTNGLIYMLQQKGFMVTPVFQ